MPDQSVCAQLRGQLVATRAERDGAADELHSAEQDLAELNSEGKHVNPEILAAAVARVGDARRRVASLDAVIADLQGQFVQAGCLSLAPQRILDIEFDNPRGVRNVDALFAQSVALGGPGESIVFGGSFPSLDAQQEWKQVLPADLTDTGAHDADYEGAGLVGTVGWMLEQDYSDKDVPFTHPMGFDWEFLMALDVPAEEPDRYTFLLTPADQSCSEPGFPEAVALAGSATDDTGRPVVPLGPDGLPSLLGVEIDSGLVPERFTDGPGGGAQLGDRVAVFGRWIVDCGHQIPVTRCGDGADIHPGLKAFRTEIHPPLLVAAARVSTPQDAAPGVLAAPLSTRLLLTSRPFLVGQRFSVDTGAALHDDAAPDDGPFVKHIVQELIKVNDTLLGIPTSSIQVEAHPKIKSYPFGTDHVMRIVVRPPAPASGTLAVAFQFTMRTGCSVTVTPGEGDSVVVTVSLEHAAYLPGGLPPRSERTWHKDELKALNSETASAIFDAEAVSALVQAIDPLHGSLIGSAVVVGILERGVKTDEYDTSAALHADILNTAHATSAPVTQIPPPDVQAQLAQLQSERASVADQVQSDQGALDELLSEKKHVNPILIRNAQNQLNTDTARLRALDDQIAVLAAHPVSGLVNDDTQPFPVFGWLEIGYLPA
jgi:hypothetical protein